MLNCGYIKNRPGRNSQQNWLSRPKGEIRKVLQKIQGENVELRVRQAFEKVLQNFGAKRLNCSWKASGRYETSFEAKKVNWTQDKLLERPILFEAILSTCISDQFWKCCRLLSEQNCWNAVKTGSVNVFEQLWDNNCRVGAKIVFPNVFRKLRQKCWIEGSQFLEGFLINFDHK